MLYRPDDAIYYTDGVIDEDKVLKDLENIDHKISELVVNLQNMYDNLNDIQHDVTIAVSSSINANKARDFNKSLKKVMDLKNKLQILYNKNMYSLFFFSKQANHLRILKKEINKDPYLKEKWNEILFYMRLKETENQTGNSHE